MLVIVTKTIRLGMYQKWLAPSKRPMAAASAFPPSANCATRGVTTESSGIQMDTIESFQLEQTPVFVRWLKGLKDVQAKAAIVLRLKQVQAGHMGDVKSVGAGVSELRWHIGPGYRVYFCRRGQQIIVLLAGGDKSTQVRDMARAKQLAKEHGHGQDDRV